MIVADMRGIGRTMRIVAYLLLAVVGGWTFYQVGSTPGIFKPLWWVLSTWMAVGGALSLLGQATSRWTGEFVGLPLIGSALIGFAILQANLYDWALAIFTSTALLLSFGLIVLARWRDILVMYRAALLAHIGVE